MQKIGGIINKIIFSIQFIYLLVNQTKGSRILITCLTTTSSVKSQEYLRNQMEIIYQIDEIISDFDSKNDKEMKSSRTQLRNLIQEYACIDINKKLTLPETVVSIEQSKSKKKRDISLILLHALSSDYIFRTREADGKLIKILDDTLPDIYKRFNIDKKDQTHEKIGKIKNIHKEFLNLLDNISGIDCSLHSILSSRQIIQKTINDKNLNAYLNFLDFNHIKRHINKYFTHISYFQTKPEVFYENIPSILIDINNELSYCESNKSFLGLIYKKFLMQLRKAIEDEKKSSKDNFRCEIKQIPNADLINQKKLPLNIVDSNIKISLPFIVEGIGNAKNVYAEISTNTTKITIDENLLSLGTIKPGEFIIPIVLKVNESIDSVVIEVIIQWRVTGDTAQYDDIFEFNFLGQDPNVDWDTLKEIDPYSLEIVYGDSFIGRKDSIRRIWTRLSSPTVSSSYITGQKRVGKSSLAHAVIEAGQSNSDNYVFIYKEYGDYGNESAKETLNDLGQQLVDDILMELTTAEIKQYTPVPFNGSLSPLIKLVSLLNKIQPKKKFVVVLDEFDEIHHELYRIGPLAETFFSNLRALSGRKNIGFILVGSEGMPHVISAQGDKLNKFSRESLDSFDKVTEWEDYENLIRLPVEKYIYWHNDAINAIYEESSGHPFFTKSICAPLINEAIRLRDSEITGFEVQQFFPNIVSLLDVNIFAHFWKDGIDGSYEDKEIISLNRRRVLIAYARTVRNQDKTTLQNIANNISGKFLNEDEVEIILNDFCIRNVMKENRSEYDLCVKLFERWLIIKGINTIIPDHLGDELAELKSTQEDEAYVLPQEILELVADWPLYQDNKITADHVRSWILQDKNLINQRILFTLLKNLEFPKESTTNEMLSNAHDSLKSSFQSTNYITRRRSDRRKDIVITYVDGAGKSGAYYAQKYTRENQISTTSNIGLQSVSKRLKQAVKGVSSLSGIIIIDDFIGTGNSLSSNLKAFVDENLNDLQNLNIPLRIVVLYSTDEGELKVQNSIQNLEYDNIDLYICKNLEDSHFSFSENTRIWKDEAERNYAKKLCRDYGLKISKRSPLGYKDQGLLLVFPRNCPNNSLTILHAGKSKGDFSWRPLFDRMQAI